MSTPDRATPAPRVVILIPYRGANPHRARAYAAVRTQADTLGWDVYAGDSGDHPFSIARTWNHLADQADADGHWDVAIRWAADCLIADTRSVRDAVQVAHHYTRAFDSGLKLTQAQTAAFHTGHPLPTGTTHTPIGGITATTREAWDTVGGFDPRFLGWGHEDRAFVHGMRVNYGHTDNAVPGKVIQLWHPREDPTDPYWTRRESNRTMYTRTVETIQTPDEWAAHLAARTTMPATWWCPDHGQDWDGACPGCPTFTGTRWVDHDGLEVPWILHP